MGGAQMIAAVLAIAGGGASQPQSGAQSGPPIVAMPMREPTPRDFTRPIVTLSCRMIDEASHWLPVTFTIVGARARYAVYPDGRKIVVEGRPSYRISSTDPRIRGGRMSRTATTHAASPSMGPMASLRSPNSTRMPSTGSGKGF